MEIKTASAVVDVGAAVPLSSVEVNDGVAISDYRWTFSDGQLLTGKTVSPSFRAGGVVMIKLEALSAGTVVATTEAQLSVVDANALAPASYGFPALLGDVDGSGAMDLGDVLLTAQASEGLVKVDSDQLAAADFDRDGHVDSTDVALMEGAVVRNEALPRAMLSAAGRPGAAVALVSPDLLPTTQPVDIRVDGRSSPQILRAVRGYASFVVPSGIVKGSAPATVQLLVNGVVKDQFALSILDPVAAPADAKADVLQFFTDLETRTTAQQDALKAQLASFSFSQDDTDALLAAGAASLSNLRSAHQAIATLLAGNGGDQIAARFQQALYSNGLAEFRSGKQTTSLQRVAASAVPDRICDTLLPLICGVKTTGKVLRVANNVLSGACTVVTAIAVGGSLASDGIAAAPLLALIDACVDANVAISVAGSVASFVEAINPGLRLTADKTTLSVNDSAIVRSQITFTGFQDLCELGAEKGGDELLKRYPGRFIVGQVIKSVPALNLLSQIFAKLGEKKYSEFLAAYVQEGISKALSSSTIGSLIDKYVAGLCPDIKLGAAQAVAANIIHPPAADEGVLAFQSDGTARYYCPPAGPVFKSSVQLVGTKELCEGNIATATLTMTCATSPVTITMGDNGNLLDDIFEVVVNGQTVLTSSVPVRSISTTIQLPKGRTEIVMRGRAAPDGVGTYFISFSGATVVSGDALSGSDLVPGASKHFIIEVL